MVPYEACFHFIGIFCYKALTVKVEKTYKTRCLEVVTIKCQGKKLFLVNIYVIYRYLKIKNRVTRFFFQIRSV